MIEPARLAFTADGTPYSETYGDVYHTAAGGLGQAQHVFLAGNGLPARWQGRERFVVVETGFGLGLNFLATWQAWRDDPARCARLHFVSVEKHPFAAADLAALHAAWPELAPLADALRREWPPLVPGLHRQHLDGGRVVLDLVFGDAADCLPQLAAQADACYLDGFSPAKNPELWTAPLLAALSALAAPGATLATWSVAAGVREALAANGWRLQKAPGFAGKREMLRGERSGGTADAGGDKRAIVLGAGLAGTTTANRLAARGWQVTLLDAAAGPGEGASGNRAGVLRPLPARDDNALARATRAGFLATRRHLSALDEAGLAAGFAASGGLWGRTGVLHLARDAVHEETQRRIVAGQRPPADYLRFVERDEARALCGWPVDMGGWWFPGGAWVSPANYCRANLLQYAASITAHYGARVERIVHAAGQWRALGANGECLGEAPHLIVANAADARRLLGDWLPVFPGRGQVTHLPAAGGSPPRCVVCRLGYVTPEIDGRRYAGATFLMRDDDPAVREVDHVENLAKLDFILPGFTAGGGIGAPSTLDGRVGFRPVSPDRLPIVGAVPRLGAEAAPPGLWLANGFGARGIVWSALAGELLADAIEDAPSILDRALAAALAPRRFIDRPQRRRPAAKNDAGQG
ncbi:MAG: bifunctional tRNA (5-methylaminomethyl-2-thiouridine)(34)-methyltransferase MnmD/FAD-dependent 5-carboxymethylaminomethyl-2-thiouridine(34) oxidoreductase MnmC [Rhodocyclaceae bacterium]|nr:bifunctional tRNA (5-methylaminomethyl-2-thiouridine)(34)-methyltransferase MnmD/FAD-dependent 5-carboxymethylaminomethyl-2-thiouridine(34) oxidoreductase MnmC [Rhodocyclaceae bacterium]